ncbi:MAG: hypothetical protein JW913_05270 [Chitinispirillaceae bacterium]|nr:hypothetical protein [Chitinispirillaceae bacterium]
MAVKRRYFTSEGYKRLEKNPFVDKEMLRFIREKWREAARETMPSVKPPPPKGGQQETPPDRRASPAASDGQKKQAEEKAIRLMTATIRHLLHE